MEKSNISIRTPYVGITGFKTKEDVFRVGEIGREVGFKVNPFPNMISFPHIMFGYISSDNRLKDRDREGKQSPPVNLLPELVNSTPDFGFPVLHYFTRSQDLYGEITELFSVGKMYERGLCRAVQLNNESLPTVGNVGRVLQNLPELEIILQLPGQLLSKLTPEKIARTVKDYEGLISCVLIDPSGGRGIDFDIDKSVEIMIALDEICTIDIGFAGGFSGDNVEERIIRIRSRFESSFYFNSLTRIMEVHSRLNSFSIDAQGKLRLDGDQTKLDYGKVKDYLDASFRGWGMRDKIAIAIE